MGGCDVEGWKGGVLGLGVEYVDAGGLVVMLMRGRWVRLFR